MNSHFIPIKGQSFGSHQEWVDYATRRLTSHPKFNDTQHGSIKGYRGKHFTAMCFDQKGRQCTSGGDFARSDKERMFPVWYIWPDQIPELIMTAAIHPVAGNPEGRGGPLTDETIDAVATGFLARGLSHPLNQSIPRKF